MRALISEKDSYILLQYSTDKNQLLGCVHLNIEDQICHIGMLTIDIQQQNKNYGKTLLTYAEEYALTRFNVHTYTMIVISARTELLEFYLRRGYKQTGQYTHYPIHQNVGTPILEDVTTGEKVDLRLEKLVKHIN